MLNRGGVGAIVGIIGGIVAGFVAGIVGVLPLFVGVLHQQTPAPKTPPLLFTISLFVMDHARHHPEFITVTCLNWKPLLIKDRFKQIIISSLHFLSAEKRVSIFAFVIMPNHMHLIWQVLGAHNPKDVQRDFLKYTAQHILKELRNDRSPVYDELLVQGSDRKRQVWERNSKCIPVWSGKFIWQKINYIHQNPVRAGLCQCPEEYEFSSAKFYYHGDRDWRFLVHCEG